MCVYSEKEKHNVYLNTADDISYCEIPFSDAMSSMIIFIANVVIEY
jgi:hypothetical protein